MNIRKFKTIYLAILIPVTVIICLASTWYRTFMFTRDVSEFLRNSNWGESIAEWSEDFNNGFSNGFAFGTGKTMGDGIEREYTDIEFSNIDIELSLANIEIKEGDEFKVILEYPENLFPEVTVDNGTLNIKHNGTINKITFNGIGSVDCDVTIYVPEGTQLGNASIDTDLGNVEIKDSLSFSSLNVVASLGNIELEEVAADELIIQADLGNVELRKCTVGKMNIAADLGDVAVKNSKFDNGKINNDLGAIEVDGEFSYLDAYCSLGALTVDCDNYDDAKMDLGADLGDIRVNGRNEGSSYHK